MADSYCNMFVYNVTPLHIRCSPTDSHDIKILCSVVCKMPGNLLLGVQLVCLNRAVFCIVQFIVAQFTKSNQLVKMFL